MGASANRCPRREIPSYFIKMLSFLIQNIFYMAEIKVRVISIVGLFGFDNTRTSATFDRTMNEC